MSAERNRLQHMLVPPCQLPLAPLPCQELAGGGRAPLCWPRSRPGPLLQHSPCKAEGPAPSRGCGPRVPGKQKGWERVANLVFQGNFPLNAHPRQIKVLFPWHKHHHPLPTLINRTHNTAKCLPGLLEWRNHKGEQREALLVSPVPTCKPLGCSSIT